VTHAPKPVASPVTPICKHCNLAIRETHMGNVRNEWEHMNGLSFCADGKHWAWPTVEPLSRPNLEYWNKHKKKSATEYMNALEEQVRCLSDELSACKESPGGCGYWREACRNMTSRLEGKEDHPASPVTLSGETPIKPATPQNEISRWGNRKGNCGCEWADSEKCARKKKLSGKHCPCECHRPVAVTLSEGQDTQEKK
jgi:hypothetical protein